MSTIRYIETYTGKCIPVPFDTDINVFRDRNLFDVQDIAHSLSMLCRYNGHCNYFYSVAEHSVRCSYSVPEEYAFEALMHDATEAYVTDVVSPLKPFLEGYKEMENNLHARLASVFGLPDIIHEKVHEVDLAMCGFEAQHLMTTGGEHWGLPTEIDTSLYPAWLNKECVDGMQPSHAKMRFLQRYQQLTRLHGIRA